ncbi:hypothetical protein MUU51_21805 [Scandinavium sp. H17S15]|nr:hypothetical protein [Dryocola boscaweniae]MCS2150960.1 hypothetical protein [Scandinavium manionii]MCT4714615.1 hypothetical protein [Dryocola boscaweniae]
MQTEAEVLTDHNELICSTSIECIVTGRETALKEIEALCLQLDEVSQLTSMIGSNTADHWAIRQAHFFNCWLMRSVDKGTKRCRLNYGMLILMDAEFRTQWAKHFWECYQQDKRYTHNG